MQTTSDEFEKLFQTHRAMKAFGLKGMEEGDIVSAVQQLRGRRGGSMNPSPGVFNNQGGFQNVPDLPGNLTPEQATGNIFMNPMQGGAQGMGMPMPNEAFPVGSPGFRAMYGNQSVNENGVPTGMDLHIRMGPDGKPHQIMMRKLQQNVNRRRTI